jgi:hypothetical protein
MSPVALPVARKHDDEWKVSHSDYENCSHGVARAFSLPKGRQKIYLHDDCSSITAQGSYRRVEPPPL